MTLTIFSCFKVRLFIFQKKFNTKSTLIRKFIKKVKKQKIIEEIRERRYYEKPTTKRRKAKINKLKNARKGQAERDKKIKLQTK